MLEYCYRKNLGWGFYFCINMCQVSLGFWGYVDPTVSLGFDFIMFTIAWQESDTKDGKPV